MVSIQRVFVPTCLFLCSQLGFSAVSAEPNFSHETNLLIDISKADFDPTDVEEVPPSSAERMLATWSSQYEITPRWNMAGNLKAFRGEVNGEGRMIFKEPQTDSGLKRSARGLLRVELDGQGRLHLLDEQTPEQEQSGELKTRFLDGELYNEEHLETLRQRLSTVR